MSRENNHDISMNSAFLEAFRKQKNEQLSAEIDFSESEEHSLSEMSSDSIYLDTFRKRKNKSLAEELNLEERKQIRTENRLFSRTEGIQQATAPSKNMFSEGEPRRNSAPDLPADFSDDDKNGQQFNPSDREKAIPSKSEWNQEKPVREQHTDFDRKTPSAKAGTALDGQNGNKKAAGKGTAIAVLVSLVLGVVCMFAVTLLLNNNSVAENDNDTTSNDTSSYSRYSTSIAKSTRSNPKDHLLVTTSTTSTENPTQTDTETTSDSDAIRYVPLSPGERSDNVLIMQARLSELGYISKKGCTGFYGENTQKTLKIFQEKVGLKPTGIADGETLARLYADDAPKCY